MQINFLNYAKYSDLESIIQLRNNWFENYPHSTAFLYFMEEKAQRLMALYGRNKKAIMTYNPKFLYFSDTFKTSPIKEKTSFLKKGFNGVVKKVLH